MHNREVAGKIIEYKAPVLVQKAKFVNPTLSREDIGDMRVTT